MEYLSSIYRQEGENISSGLLLQAYYKPKRMPVLLAAVCERNQSAEKGLLMELKEWFYGTGLFLCAEKGERGFDRARKQLGRKCFPPQADFNAFLCAGNHFLWFGQGEPRVYLLNQRNNHSLCRKLTTVCRKTEGVQEKVMWKGTIRKRVVQEENIRKRAIQEGTIRKRAIQEETIQTATIQERILQEGIVQEGIGILLVTEGFRRVADEAYLAEKLDRRAMLTQRNMEERMKKAGKILESRGGSNMSAVLFCTK